MQDEMVAELKAAGSNLLETSRCETAAVMESGVTDIAVNESSAGIFKSQVLEGFEDLAATPRAAALKQSTPISGAKKKPGPPAVSGGHGAPSSAKRGRVGRKGGKGRRKPGRPAGGASTKTGGAKKPTRTRLSISDFDGVAQVQRVDSNCLDFVHIPYLEIFS